MVAEVPAKSLADECPTYQLDADQPDLYRPLRARALDDLKVSDHSAALLQLLARPNIASKRWVWEQYDHMVQTNTAVLSRVRRGILRIRGVSSGIAFTTDCMPGTCNLDPCLGAKMAAYEAARNLVCLGSEAGGCDGLPELRESREARCVLAVPGGGPWAGGCL